MPQPAPNVSQRFSYADYLTWPADERWELIGGQAVAMTPAPRPRHQEVVGNLYMQFRHFLQGKPCRVYLAPFDVRFPPAADAGNDAVDTVVQPDISIVCDAGKIDERGCVGPPDLVVEVLSEESGGRDEGTKFMLYQRQGVREYWIVNTWDETVRVYTRNDQGRYDFPALVTRPETAQSKILASVRVELARVFGG